MQVEIAQISLACIRQKAKVTLGRASFKVTFLHQYLRTVLGVMD